MKKIIASLTASLILVSTLASCGGKNAVNPAAAGELTAPIRLSVVTSYGDTTANRATYEKSFKQWEQLTGNLVDDMSVIYNEDSKARILGDFDAGTQPDVLFFSSGADADRIVQAAKVVPIDEIRREYPGYASNMDDAKITPSPFDGRIYAVPTSGFWEGLYVNKAVVEQAGATVPTADTTWEEFLEICEKIKVSGKTPIAVSLAEAPHYWFEYAVFNNGSKAAHEILPANSDDPVFQNWVNGINDIKDLYEKGYLPAATNSISDADAWSMFINSEAAFAIDNNRKINFIAASVYKLSNFTVTFVPGKGERKPTDMIGGLSMGYYISRKAWENPIKRAAAVDFVTHMTSDASVNALAGGTSATALKSRTATPAKTNVLTMDAMLMLDSSTGTVGEAQEKLSSEAKQIIFSDNMKKVVTAAMSAEDSVAEALAKNSSVG